MKEKKERIEDALIPPHKVQSREVTETDIERIIKDAPLMMTLCIERTGYHKRGGYAVAHSQITSEDPLRFFVLRDGTLVINPRIEQKTKFGKHVWEGCLTFPDKKPTFIPRSYKCEVTFQGLSPDGKQLTERFGRTVKGIEAQIFQHEIEHFDGEYIYPVDKDLKDSNK